MDSTLPVVFPRIHPDRKGKVLAVFITSSNDRFNTNEIEMDR